MSWRDVTAAEYRAQARYALTERRWSDLRYWLDQLRRIRR